MSTPHKNAPRFSIAEAGLSVRNGPTGTAKLTYLTQFTRFENYAPEEDAFGDAED
jgi:replicative DNA helicase